MDSIKTIFISSFHGFISRNILSTDIFKILSNKNNLRIVILTPKIKEDYFRKRFGSKNVIIESIDIKLNKLDTIIKLISFSLIDNKFIYIRKREKLRRDKKYFRFFISRFFAKLFGKSIVIKKFIRFINYKFLTKDIFKNLFDKYSPDLIFSTDIYHNWDIALIKEAKKNRIFTIGMVRSWDNISTKGIIRMLPDRIVVHNKILAEEADEYNGIKKDIIFVSGIPHYDYYVAEKRSSREEFFKRIGLDPNKRLILYAPGGINFYRYDGEILKLLQQFKNKGLIPADTQFLVRFPPGDEVMLQDFKPDKNFILEKPGVDLGHIRNTELDKSDMIHLSDSLYHSDIIINLVSTMSIDAAAFDKPVIVIFFDAAKKNYFESAARLAEYSHFKKMLSAGGCSEAGNKDELVYWINQYLKHPETKKEQRKKLVKEQCWRLDGKSGERIANYLLKFINLS